MSLTFYKCSNKIKIGGGKMKKTMLGVIGIAILFLMSSPIFASGSKAPDPAELAVRRIADKIADKFIAAGQGNVVVAIATFANLGPHAIDKKMGEIVSQLLIAELAKKQNIKVVERQNLDKLLKELRLSFLGITNPRLASRIGKMVNAQYMVVGGILEEGADFVITARVVDVATSRIIAAFKDRIHQKDMIALSSKYLVLKTKTGALYRSLIVPGWGQIYSGHVVKGVFFTAVTYGLVASALFEYYMGQNVYYNDKYKKAKNTNDAEYYFNKAQTSIKTGNQLLIGGMVLWVVNMVDAYASGVNGSEVRVMSGTILPFNKGVSVAFNYRF